MKILSKYKDYYDYLQGVYGVDEKIVLDRRDFSKPYISDGSVVTVFIGDMAVDVLKTLDGEFICGEKLLDYKVEKDRYDRFNSPKDTIKIEFYSDNSYWTGIKIQYRFVHTEAYKHNRTDLKCPIYCKGSNYPPLAEMNIGSVLTPHAIWVLLSNYLVKNDEVENIMNDKDKVYSHGFDDTSFRNTNNRLK